MANEIRVTLTYLRFIHITKSSQNFKNYTWPFRIWFWSYFRCYINITELIFFHSMIFFFSHLTYLIEKIDGPIANMIFAHFGSNSPLDSPINCMHHILSPKLILLLFLSFNNYYILIYIIFFWTKWGNLAS